VFLRLLRFSALNPPTPHISLPPLNSDMAYNAVDSFALQ
jgi:hypothetical protein